MSDLGLPRPVPWESRVDAALLALARVGIGTLRNRAAAPPASAPPPADQRQAGSAFSPTFRPTDDGSPVEYVIVTSELFAAEFERLAAWKTQKGVRAVVRTVEWIDASYAGGLDRAERLRFFLRDAYLYWGTLWVLLGGDTDWVPVRYAASTLLQPSGSVEEIPADLYYACLDGDWNGDGDALFGEALPPGQPTGGDTADLVPELWLGRAPVSTEEEAAVFVDRVLRYEQDPPLDELFAGSLLSLGEVLSIQLDGAVFCEEVVDLAPPWTRTVRLYENDTQYPGALPEDVETVVDSINAGFALIHHVGHGFRTTMSVGVGSLDNSIVSTLVNGGRLSAVVALNCSSGAFDFNAIGERLVLNPAGGAIAFIGLARFAIPTPAHDFQRELFTRLWSDSLTSLGAALAIARTALVPLSEPGDTAHRWSQLALNLLGDPETPLWLRPATRLSVTHTASFELGAGEFQVTVEAAAEPVAGATVCLWKEDAYAVAETGADGVATLPWTPASPGSFTVTATLQGAVPALSAAEAEPTAGSFLVATGAIVDDQASGNGDGRADQGESLTLHVTLENRGAAPATSIVAELGGAASLVTVAGGPLVLGDLNPGDSLQAAFELLVATGIPPASKPLLPLTVGANEHVTEDVIALPLHVPELAQLDHLLDDALPGGNHNGIAEAGEYIRWWPTIQNRGNGAATGVTATLRILNHVTGAPDPLVALEDSTAAIGALEPLASATGDSFSFTLSSSAVPAELRLELRLTDAHGAETIEWLDLTPPAVPTDLAASASSVSVTLTWIAPLAADLLGYDIYRGETPFGPFQRVNPVPLISGSLFTEAGLPGYTTFHYGVVARDSSANRSPLSEIVTVATGPPRKLGWPIAMAQEATGAVVIGDLDGLPGMELVTGADAIYAWHADGTELRDGDSNALTSGVFSIDGRSPQRGFLATPAIADLDRDGQLDLIGVAWDEQAVHAWSIDGVALPGWPQLLDAGFNWASPVVDDLDLDGDLEVLAVSGKYGRLYGWHHDGSEIRDGDGDPATHGVLFETGTTFLYATPAVGDVDGDMFLEIVLGTNHNTGALHVLDHLGVEQPAFPRLLGGQITASAALADLNDNGRLEIVVSAESDALYVIDGQNGDDLPGWPQPAITHTATGRTSSPVVCDLDLDGVLDVLYAASDGRFHVWNASGELLPGWEMVRFADVNQDATQATPTVADLDDDGLHELLLGTEAGLIWGWNDDGSPMAGFPLPVGSEVRGSTTIWDVDEDGLLELCVPAFDRQLYVWELLGPLRRDRIGWPFMRRDVRNTGRVGEEFLATALTPSPAPGLRLALLPPRPNPSARGAQVRFSLSDSGPRAVRLRLYDVQGRLVRLLLDRPLTPGWQEYTWDGRDSRGARVASGTYFLRLESGAETRIGKLTVVR